MKMFIALVSSFRGHSFIFEDTFFFLKFVISHLLIAESQLKNNKISRQKLTKEVNYNIETYFFVFIRLSCSLIVTSDMVSGCSMSIKTNFYLASDQNIKF